MGRVFRPYDFTGNGIEIDLEDFKLDGEVRPHSMIDEDSKELNLVSRDFDSVTLEFSYDVPIDVSEYTPEDDPSVEILVLLQNPLTHARQILLREGVEDDGIFEVSLEKEDFRGIVEIESFLVRTENYEGEPTGFAELAHKKIASGTTWNVKFDEKTASGTGLLCKWKDFTKMEDDEITGDMMFYLRTSSIDEPVLYLNQKSDKMRNMMDNHLAHGKNAQIRDVLNDAVFGPTMFQLLLRSIASVDQEEFEGAYVEETLFDHMSRKMDLNEEEKREIAGMLDDTKDMDRLGKLLSKYIQRTNNMADDIRKMVDKVGTLD